MYYFFSLFCVLSQYFLGTVCWLTEFGYEVFCTLVVKGLPIEVAKIVYMGKKGCKSVPRISMKLASWRVFNLAGRRQGLFHLNQQALSHFQSNLHHELFTFDFYRSDNLSQSLLVTKALITSLMHAFFYPILMRASSPPFTIQQNSRKLNKSMSFIFNDYFGQL